MVASCRKGFSNFDISNFKLIYDLIAAILKH